jgi:hypothetical protein
MEYTKLLEFILKHGAYGLILKDGVLFSNGSDNTLGGIDSKSLDIDDLLDKVK